MAALINKSSDLCRCNKNSSCHLEFSEHLETSLPFEIFLQTFYSSK